MARDEPLLDKLAVEQLDKDGRSFLYSRRGGSPGFGESNAWLAALYHLFLFDRDVRQRLEQCRTTPGTSLSLAAELGCIRA
ncbi:hypothetical protein BJY01DRAFT_217717 [Aspergillus pseudoustus]|uniref:Uncharacterized protein n=1 Tax=Aspergillus pseudoustus TaxID=1810923 RepID=A0ABR4JMF9_9EURO